MDVMTAPSMEKVILIYQTDPVPQLGYTFKGNFPSLADAVGELSPRHAHQTTPTELGIATAPIQAGVRPNPTLEGSVPPGPGETGPCLFYTPPIVCFWKKSRQQALSMVLFSEFQWGVFHFPGDRPETGEPASENRAGSVMTAPYSD